MAGVETWQQPAADDINPDALEYLFTAPGLRTGSPPWVDVIAQPDPAARPTPEMLRLQTKIEMLAAEVELLSTRLQQANCQVGYLTAELAQKQQVMETLPQLRIALAQAAHSYRTERRNHLRMLIDLLIYLVMICFAWSVLALLLS